MRPSRTGIRRLIGGYLLPASKFQSAAAGKASAPKAKPSGSAVSRSGASRAQPGSAANPAIDYDTGQVTPLAMLHNAVRFWWVLFLAIVLGGLAGWLASSARPPVYEGVARFSGRIDYTSTGPLTQFEEDTAYNTIGDILLSKGVVQDVADEANAQGISVDPVQLRQSVYRERKFDIWELRIRRGDPQTAQKLAEIWAEKGHAALLESYRHALLADQISQNIRTLESCLGRAVQGEISSPVCSKARFSEIQNDLYEAVNALYKEQKASFGMFAGLIPGPAEMVTPSQEPVHFGRNQLVLAGGIIGLLAGLLVIETGLLARWFR